MAANMFAPTSTFFLALSPMTLGMHTLSSHPDELLQELLHDTGMFHVAVHQIFCPPRS